MSVTFAIVGSQFKGSRDYQEDAFLVTHMGIAHIGKDDMGALVIVADGMGGQAAGHVASNLVAQTFSNYVTAHYASDSLPQIFLKGLEAANHALAVTIRETEALTGMGSTLVAALFEKSLFDRASMRWISVGDSHLYLLRSGELQKKNEDHSYGAYLNRLAAEGNLSEPEPGYTRNMLLSSITGGEIALIDCPQARLQLEEGDRIIIATDGLDTLSSSQIVDICKGSASTRECVDALIAGVMEAKKRHQDNTTVVVVDVLTKPSTASGPPTRKVVPPPNTIRTGKNTLGRSNVGSISKPQSKGISPGKRKARILRIWGGFAAVAAMLVVINQAPEPHTEIMTPARTGLGDAETRPLTGKGSAVKEAASPPEQVSLKRKFRNRLKGGGLGPEMVWVPPGSFDMGGTGLLAGHDEQPKRKVRIAKFAISTYEITWADYKRFARETGSRLASHLPKDKENYPVVSVTWDEAVAYTRWLSQQTGHRYRLPSEAEWEYAASGGTTSLYWWGSDSGKDQAYCHDCGLDLGPRQPTQVGQFKPNPFGLYDTAGNVMEWVQDCYHPSYDGAPTDGSARETGNCSLRVARGGAYSSAFPSLRTRKRDRYPKDQRYDNVGFRVVREP